MSNGFGNESSPPQSKGDVDHLKESISLYEELRAQSALFAEQSQDAFEQAGEAAGQYASQMEEANGSMDPQQAIEYAEALATVAKTTETTTNQIADTFGILMAKDMWNPKAVVRWDQALKDLGRNLTAKLISAVASLAAQQLIASAATKNATTANYAYAASIQKVAIAYATLVAFRAANKAIPGAGMVVHSGGYILHQGGPVRMHSGGLRHDERPAILQQGEYVIRRAAVKGIGMSALDYMNSTGDMPGSTGTSGGSASFQFNIQALDGQSVENVVREKIVPALERLSRNGWMELS